jgi:hypothetical protein
MFFQIHMERRTRVLPLFPAALTIS